METIKRIQLKGKPPYYIDGIAKIRRSEGIYLIFVFDGTAGPIVPWTVDHSYYGKHITELGEAKRILKKWTAMYSSFHEPEL